MSHSVLPTAADLQLQKRSLRVEPRKILKQSSEPTEMTPEMVASVVFDAAAIRFGQKNAALAITLGVSESLISRWRNPEHREVPSLVQVIALGADFQRLFVKEQSKFYGFGRKALLDLVDAVGELSVAVGE